MSSAADQQMFRAERDPAVAARVGELYERHGGLVRSVCRSLLRDRVEAEDAVQQTFLSAQRALVNGSSPRDGAAWLATIARHESLARVRVRMREPLVAEVEERDTASDAHTAAVRRQEAGELRDALAELPAQQREAILLREVRGFSYQEVAASLSVTTSAVESLLFRARRSLQTRLQEALAGFAPGAWVQPLRDLVAGGGLVAPAAAKVAAVGLGTAVVTGGALVGPAVLGLGHAPNPVRRASPPSAHKASHVVVPKAPVSFSARPSAPATHHAGADSRSAIELSDRQSTAGTQERGDRSSDGATTTTSNAGAGDASSTSGSTREVSDDTGTQQAGSGSTDNTQTGTTTTTTNPVSPTPDN